MLHALCRFSRLSALCCAYIATNFLPASYASLSAVGCLAIAPFSSTESYESVTFSCTFTVLKKALAVISGHSNPRFFSFHFIPPTRRSSPFRPNSPAGIGFLCTYFCVQNAWHLSTIILV